MRKAHCIAQCSPLRCTPGCTEKTRISVVPADTDLSVTATVSTFALVRLVAQANTPALHPEWELSLTQITRLVARKAIPLRQAGTVLRGKIDSAALGSDVRYINNAFGLGSGSTLLDQVFLLALVYRFQSLLGIGSCTGCAVYRHGETTKHKNNLSFFLCLVDTPVSIDG